MARSFAVFALIVSAFCFSSVLAARKAPTHGAELFTVVGKIYCDPCHFEFESRLSKPLDGTNFYLFVLSFSQICDYFTLKFA